MAKKDNIVYLGTGRRKKSIARVRLFDGDGKIFWNRNIKSYSKTTI